ncbi:MAG: VCBS repeat-containing protein [Acidovorax sp.]|nr:MAG: VCBS repeat-containing protein [Acidovorax sp.]
MVLLSNSLQRLLSVMVVGSVLAACQTQPQNVAAQNVAPKSSAAAGAGDSGRLQLDLPDAWGGDVRCGAQGCLLGAVEHEKNTVVVHKLESNRTSRLLSKFSVPYHPDSAAWLADDVLAAAVEDGSTVDIFRLIDGKLVKIQSVTVGFGPRDVTVIDANAGRYRLLATPYSGTRVAWIDWQDGASGDAQVRQSTWCKSPWHPTKVSQLPKMKGGGIAVACLDDRRVVAVPESDPMATPTVLATFNAIPRRAAPSPSGRWLYVGLETGSRNARIDMQTGELQWIAASPNGSVSVVAMSDDLVIWGEDSRLVMQRLDAQGAVLESGELPASGFSTDLQVLDVDGDGALDVVVLNSAGTKSDVIYGPLWEKALKRPLAKK